MWRKYMQRSTNKMDKNTECDIIIAGDFNAKLKINKENSKQTEQNWETEKYAINW